MSKNFLIKLFIGSEAFLFSFFLALSVGSAEWIQITVKGRFFCAFGGTDWWKIAWASPVLFQLSRHLLIRPVFSFSPCFISFIHFSCFTSNVLESSQLRRLAQNGLQFLLHLWGLETFRLVDSNPRVKFDGESCLAKLTFNHSNFNFTHSRIMKLNNFVNSMVTRPTENDNWFPLDVIMMNAHKIYKFQSQLCNIFARQSRGIMTRNFSRPLMITSWENTRSSIFFVSLSTFSLHILYRRHRITLDLLRVMFMSLPTRSSYKHEKQM